MADNEPDIEFPARARGLRDLLAAERATGESTRRLSEPALRGMHDAGMFRAWVPRAFGGFEVGLADMTRAASELTRGDPSAGWLLMILGTGDWLAGMFPASAQQEVFGSQPDTRICQVLTPKAQAVAVEGGWRLSGQWAPASGCLHSQWAILGAQLSDEAAFLLVPMQELTVHDTWFTLGMRATGSNLLSAENVFVPEHRVLRREPLLRGDFPEVHPAAPRYRTALVPTLMTFLIAPMLAMAEQAFEQVSSRAHQRGIAFTTYERQAESTSFQLTLAEADTKLDVVRLILQDNITRIEEHACAGTHPDRLERARLRRNGAYAVRHCREVVDALVTAAGASALAEGDPLESLLRDVQTAARHAIARPDANAEVWAREFFGLHPNISPML